MKFFLSLATALSLAGPVLSHTGAHVHLHASSGAPVLAGLVVIAAGLLVAARTR